MKIPFFSRWFKPKNSTESSTLSYPEQWFINLLGGTEAKAGVRVNEENALQVMAVFACIRLLSNTIATMPFELFRDKNEIREKAYNHNLHYLLTKSPNDEMVAFNFWQALMNNALFLGYGYAEVVRDNSGNITELWPIPTERVRQRRNSVTKELFWEVNAPDGQIYTLYPENMFSIRGFTRDGITSYKPLKLAQEAIGLSIATEEFGSRFFSNGTNLGGIVEYPGKMSDEAYERYKSSFESGYSGLGKSNRLIFLEEGLKFTKINTAPNDSQFIETRKHQVLEICRFFNVPPHKIMDLDRATFSNIEQQSLDFYSDSILPWSTQIEQAIHKDLLNARERKIYYVKHNFRSLLRVDFKTRMEGYAIARQNGWLNADEIRALEDMNPIPEGEGGNKYLVNGNMVPINKAGENIKQQQDKSKGGDNADG